MGTSDQSNQPWVVEQLQTLNLKSMLDVGAGSGTYGHVFAQHLPDVERFAVEAWEPCISEFVLKDVYTEVFNHDIRDHEFFNYDIVIFGDVLEHMTKEEALAVWDKVSKQAKYALIAIPIIHYPQGALYGNPFEVHVKDDWTHEEVLSTFPEITTYITGTVVGSYLAKF
jgi:cyclopropane fatty-acyl-phospholipid synthase-like methyltransferase